MSNDGPTITVTRGSKKKAPKRPSRSSDDSDRSATGFALPSVSTLVSGVFRGVRSTWWAGLGVIAVVRDAGSTVFDALVDEGKSWEQARREDEQTRARGVQKLEEATGRVEIPVQQQVETMLRAVGVPRRDEIEGLREQIDVLDEKIERLSLILREGSDS